MHCCLHCLHSPECCKALACTTTALSGTAKVCIMHVIVRQSLHMEDHDFIPPPPAQVTLGGGEGGTKPLSHHTTPRHHPLGCHYGALSTHILQSVVRVMVVSSTQHPSAQSMPHFKHLVVRPSHSSVLNKLGGGNASAT